MDKKIFINVSLPGEGGGYTTTLEEAKEAIDELYSNAIEYGDFEGAYEFKAVEMTIEEYDNLAEFKGF